MAALTAQGSVLKLSDMGGTPTFTAIGEVIGVSGLGGGGATEIDVTDLSSTGKEFILGLKDEGEITISMNLDTGDTQQTALRTARDEATVRDFQLDLTSEYFEAGPLSGSVHLSGVSTIPPMGPLASQTLPIRLQLEANGNHKSQDLVLKEMIVKHDCSSLCI